MTITLCGENTYAIHHALHALVGTFVQSAGEAALERLEGTDVTPVALRGQLNTMSLFAPQKLIILKNPSENKELMAELGGIATQTSEGTTLVIVDSILDKRTKTYKTLKAKSDFKEFAALTDHELRQWIVAEVKKEGGSMTPRVAAQLIESVGHDQWQLKAELDKLLALDKEITASSVEALVVPNLEVSAFALLDAVMSGRFKENQALFKGLKTQSDPYEFFGLLSWQAQALSVAAFAPPGISDTQLAKETGLKPFVLQKAGGLARRFGTTKVKEMVEEVATLDMRLKSSGVDPWLLVEQTLVKVSG